jgi:hypothetical protein
MSYAHAGIYDGTYGNAVNSAQKAFVIQTGIQKDLDKFGQFAKDQAAVYGVQAPAAAAVFVYKVYKDKSVSLPLSKTTSITVDQQAIKFKLTF